MVPGFWMRHQPGDQREQHHNACHYQWILGELLDSWSDLPRGHRATQTPHHETSQAQRDDRRTIVRSKCARFPKRRRRTSAAGSLLAPSIVSYVLTGSFSRSAASRTAVIELGRHADEAGLRFSTRHVQHDAFADVGRLVVRHESHRPLGPGSRRLPKHSHPLWYR